MLTIFSQGKWHNGGKMKKIITIRSKLFKNPRKVKYCVRLMTKPLLKWFISSLLLLTTQISSIRIKIKTKLFKSSKIMSLKSWYSAKLVKKIKRLFVSSNLVFKKWNYKVKCQKLQGKRKNVIVHVVWKNIKMNKILLIKITVNLDW